MKKFKMLFMVVILTSTFTAAVFAETPENQLNSLLSNFHSMSANFKQNASIKKGTGKTSSGSMAIQRPGKFRWEIAQPNHQIIIADGKNLWIYDVDLEQATKKKLTKDTNSPAILLSGSTSAIEKRFKITSFRERGDRLHFQLKPKQNHDMFQSVELEFINQMLSIMSVNDNLGSKTTFYFSNVKVNPRLSPKLFIFQAPKNVDVLAE